jgi:prepilin-type N-terminal cleavage/methylation domain-containing protein
MPVRRSSNPTEGRGFTLLEVLVALFIFTLLGGSIFMVIRSTSDAYRKGSISMEVYQSIRVGMNRMMTDLRRAVSPESLWNDMLEEEEEDVDEFIDQVTGLEAAPEEEHRDIVFSGSISMVRFVTEDILPRGDRAFDLREVVYRVDAEHSVLIKEIRDSIIRRRLNEYRAEMTENESEYRSARPEDFEWFGEPEVMVVANNVVQMTLAYFDGNEWWESWDSEQTLPEYDCAGLPPEECPEGAKEKYGLPDAVAVTMVLTNGDSIFGITEIPARDLDLLLAVNETAFGTREYRSRLADNREREEHPRWGMRALEDRQDFEDAFQIGSHERWDARSSALRKDRHGVERGLSNYRGRSSYARSGSSRYSFDRRSSRSSSRYSSDRRSSRRDSSDRRSSRRVGTSSGSSRR